MANEAAQDVDSLGDLYQFMRFIAAALGLALYLQVIHNRHYWVIMEVCLGALNLLSVPFAHATIHIFLTNGGDVVSVYMYRLLLVTLVGQAVAIYFTKDSTDPSVPISITIANILIRGSLLICSMYGILNVRTMSSFNMKAEIVIFALLLIGDFLHLSKLSTRDAHLTVGDPISWHLSVDAMVTFLFGSVLLGFPKLFVGLYITVAKLTYQLFTRAFGCVVIGGSLLSFASLTFKNVDDTMVVLKSKFLVYVSSVLLAIFHCLVDEKFQSSGHLFVMLGIVGALAFNAGYAIWQEEKKKQA